MPLWLSIYQIISGDLQHLMARISFRHQKKIRIFLHLSGIWKRETLDSNSKVNLLLSEDYIIELNK